MINVISLLANMTTEISLNEGLCGGLALLLEQYRGTRAMPSERDSDIG
jgi:hypothetical protein